MAAELFYHEVFRALDEAGVRFVVVGGVAVNLQGVPRFTADLDVAVALETDNLRAAGEALSEIGLVPRLPVPLSQLADLTIVRGWIEERNLRAFTFHDPKRPLREVDLLLDTPVAYGELERTADRMESGGVRIAVASVDALIRMKQKTGRAQDVSDADALTRIRDASDE